MINNENCHVTPNMAFFLVKYSVLRYNVNGNICFKILLQ